MTGNLKLIITENFGDLPCNFYRSANGDILLTREQIGTALEYANPQKAIDNIHAKHRDRLDELSITLRSRGMTGQEYPTTFYSQRGIMEICRWSRQNKANQFMDWVWNIVENYRDKNINQDTQLLTDLLSRFIDTMNSTLTTINDRIVKLEEQNNDKPQLIENTYRKPYNPWFTKMQPKYQLMEDYFSISRGQLYKNILLELENLYDIDTHQIQADYCYENNLSSCFPLEPYEFNPKLREMVEQIVNSNLIKYGITAENDPIASTKHITIFDSPVL